MGAKGWYIIRESELTFSKNGAVTPVIVKASNSNFSKIIKCLKVNDFNRAEELSDSLYEIKKEYSNQISVKNGELIMGGQVMRTGISNQIIKTIMAGGRPDGLIEFQRKAINHPDPRMIGELCAFVESNGLPVTREGDILAYKSVRKDYMDHYSGTVCYKVGMTPMMDRKAVNNNPEETCSSGLHACAARYFKGSLFGGDRNSRVVLVMIRPKDVVSIPTDYSGAKMRCERMTVLAEINANTGDDVLEMDEQVKKNIASFANNVSLSASELDDLVGITRINKADVSHPDEGKKVVYNSPNGMKKGYVVGVVPAGIAVEKAIKEINRTTNPAFPSSATVNAQLYTDLLNNKSVSLDERVVLIDEEEMVSKIFNLTVDDECDCDRYEDFGECDCDTTPSVTFEAQLRTAANFTKI